MKLKSSADILKVEITIISVRVAKVNPGESEKCRPMSSVHFPFYSIPKWPSSLPEVFFTVTSCDLA